jgi:hypothetical protein
MGRNDVVEDITGTRNVFVDYPEYAWLLFGKSVPQNMVTPSKAMRGEDFGDSSDSSENNSSSSENSSSSSENSSSSSENSSSGNLNDSEESSAEKTCKHEYNEWFVTKKPTPTQAGEQVRVCEKCGKEDVEAIPPLGGEENSSTEEEDGEGLLAGCGATVGLSVSGILLLAGCFLFLKERKN